MEDKEMHEGGGGTLVEKQTSGLVSAQPTAIALTGDGITLYEKLNAFVKERLVEDLHYGQIKDARTGKILVDKPVLFKGGAQILAKEAQLRPRYEIIHRECDYDEPFFAYEVECMVYRNDDLAPQGVGHGACNSKEKKYTSQYVDKYFIQNTVLKMAKKRAYVEAVIEAWSASSVFSQDMEDFKQDTTEGDDKPDKGRSNGATDPDYWRKKAMALGKELGYTDWKIRDICKKHFMQYDPETGEVKRGKDGKPLHVTSRSQMQLAQWEKLAQEFQKRLDARKAAGKIDPVEVGESSADKAEEPDSEPLSTNLEDLTAGLTDALGRGAVDIRNYLETVYLCDLATVDGPKQSAIVRFLQRVTNDTELQKRVRDDVAATFKWIDNIEKDHPGDVYDALKALSVQPNEVIQKFYEHMGAPVAKAQRIRAIDPARWSSWRHVLELAQTEVETPEAEDDVPYA